MLPKETIPTLEEEALQQETGLPAREVDRRLVTLARQHQRIEAALCFYLREINDRVLYKTFGFSSTIDYARERLGFEERKTWSLLSMAVRFKVLPKLAETFARGELPWTKVREAVKVATPATEGEWLRKCKDMSNRQLEQEVRRSLPPVRKKTLLFVLGGLTNGKEKPERKATMVREAQANYTAEEADRGRKRIWLTDHVISAEAVERGPSKPERTYPFQPRVALADAAGARRDYCCSG